MLTSLALIFLVGLALAALCQKLKLPRIIGMLATGILLGPCVLNVLDGSILSISADLRKLALVIILLKAGLSLDLGDLKKVGRPAILMSCLPATCEIIGYVLLAPCFLGITRVEAAVMGAVLAAVSPAVVVPRMVQLMESGRGTDKSIPQMILAGASCDDIFVIVLFTTFLHTAQGGSANAADFLSIPASIVLGVALGALVGWLFSRFFETAYARSHCIRNSMKVIIVLGVSLLLVAAEGWLEGIVPVSGLLAVVSMACLLKMKCTPFVAKRLSEKFGKLWLAAEVILFVLVGAAVDIRYMAGVGLAAVGMIFSALIFRAVGVCLCLVKTPLTAKERLFCVFAYLPKATVQAAIGSVPLAAGAALRQHRAVSRGARHRHHRAARGIFDGCERAEAAEESGGIKKRTWTLSSKSFSVFIKCSHVERHICALHYHHKDGNEDELQDDAGDGRRHRAGEEEGEAELRALKAREQELHKAPHKAARDHRGDERGIDAPACFRQLAVQKTGDGAVGRHFKRHGNSDPDRRHAGHRAQQRGDKADRESPRPAAHEAAQQRGNVHGTEHGANLGDLTGQKRQDHRQGEEERGIGEFSHRGSGTGSCSGSVVHGLFSIPSSSERMCAMASSRMAEDFLSTPATYVLHRFIGMSTR